MIISALIWLLGKLSEKSLDQILDHFKKEKEIKSEFMQIYTSIERAGQDGEVFSSLSKLKDFFQRNYKLLKEDEISAFYDKRLKNGPGWIMRANGFSEDKHAELMIELSNIKSLI